MSIHLLQQVPAQSLHTLALSGYANTLVDLESPNDIDKVIDYAFKHKLKIIPLGEGSNLVFPREAAVLWLRPRFTQIEIIKEDNEQLIVKAAAGLNWHDWVSYCLKHGWHGLENLALIPGCVGAAPIQNIGAYGVELDQFVESVEAICIKAFDDRKAGDKLSLSRDECEFSYRGSIFKNALQDKVLVTAIRFRLSRTFRPNIHYKALTEFFKAQDNFDLKYLTAQQLFDAVVSIRTRRLPDVKAFPNAGSFFKNPIVSEEAAEALKMKYSELPVFEAGPAYGSDFKKLSAAWLIENAGLKGYQNKGIQISEQHALVLINQSAHQLDPAKRASSDDVLEMSRHIIKTVIDKFAVTLVPEPRMRF